MTALDVGIGEVELADGERLPYDRLLLATGAEPRRLAVPGAELPGVHHLRTLADADALSERFARGGRVLVVGAGWIGAEVAATARGRGLDVVLLERGLRPLERVLGPELGEFYARVHRDHGVGLLAGAELAALEGGDAVERARLADGRAIDCDLVVAGIGVEPRTRLAEGAGIEVWRGILTDDRLETSAPGVFAAGDVAAAWHPFYDSGSRSSTGPTRSARDPRPREPCLGEGGAYDRLPYFFSDQYDVGMEYTGHPSASAEVAFRGDPASREFVAFWLESGRVSAVMGVNVWDAIEPAKELIRSRRPVDLGRLLDPGVPLAELAAPVSA